jgi:phosphoglycerate kinase
MPKKSIRELDVDGKRVLVRVDFNVPLANGRVSDDTRIRAALPTLEYLIERHAKLILCSHLGRPKGRSDPAYSLKPAAERLSQLIERPVQMAPDCIGPVVKEQAAAVRPGQLLLLENLRFHPEEEANEATFCRELAALADVYVNDAFGSAHRAHASTAGVTASLPAVAGLLMERELNFLGKALTDPDRPFVAILGGAKVSDKIGVIERLLGTVDRLLIGGGMANTFLKAQGKAVGQSLLEADTLELARSLLRQGGDTLMLPEDVCIADRFDAEAQKQTVSVDSVPDEWRILDIGPQTIARFTASLQNARTVVWNGPMGVFEMPPFAVGTFALARALAELTQATTIIGGGDSAAAVEQSGLADQMTHISTGGGASLEFLEGKQLPGVAALQDA